MRRVLFVLAIFCFVPLPALAGKDADRTEMQVRRDKTLARLFKEEPGARADIESAEGYATFSSGGINIFFVSAAYGSGIAHDNKSGTDTYMEMASGGLGIGLGIKDYRLVFVFRTRDAFNQFVDHGWDLSGQADAAAKAGGEGGELSEAADAMPGVKVYQLTENGLALQATIQGTKYWADDELNY